MARWCSTNSVRRAPYTCTLKPVDPAPWTLNSGQIVYGVHPQSCNLKLGPWTLHLELWAGRTLTSRCSWRSPEDAFRAETPPQILNVIPFMVGPVLLIGSARRWCLTNGERLCGQLGTGQSRPDSGFDLQVKVLKIF